MSKRATYFLTLGASDKGIPALISDRSVHIRVDTFEAKDHVITLTLDIPRKMYLANEVDFLTQIQDVYRMTYQNCAVKRWCSQEDNTRYVYQTFRWNCLIYCYHLFYNDPFLKCMYFAFNTKGRYLTQYFDINLFTNGTFLTIKATTQRLHQKVRQHNVCLLTKGDLLD